MASVTGVYLSSGFTTAGPGGNTALGDRPPLGPPVAPGSDIALSRSISVGSGLALAIS
jgi:hypothetical protein